jgi:hypothetical protein
MMRFRDVATSSAIGAALVVALLPGYRLLQWLERAVDGEPAVYMGGETTMIWLLLGALFLLAMLAIGLPAVFKALGLANSQVALGLPDGSVRAVIALLLVALFATAPVYLFKNIGGTPQTISGMDGDTKDKFIANNPTLHPVIVGVPGLKEGSAATYTAHFYQPSDPASVDFAKQMLVLLGTLATAVASFYFGAKTATSAAAAGATAAGHGDDGTPTLTLRSITDLPPAITRDDNGQVSFDLHLLGSNLNAVNTVKLVSGTDQTQVKSGVVSNEGEVKCKVEFKPKADKGAKWDVSVIDGSGNASNVLAAALTLN